MSATDAEPTVVIHGDAWKWRDIEEDVAWCRTMQWERRQWCPSDNARERDGMSAHDHCQICWWTLADSEDPAVSVGYHSGEQLWICTECHEKFIAGDTPSI